jgi:hypothetical protein
VNEDLQAPIQSDAHCRCRAWQIIALLYGLAAVANLWWWVS